MAKGKKTKTYFEDGISLRAIEPGKLYSARIRIEPDAHLGGEHEKWYWSKSRQIEASSKARALVEAERYRKEWDETAPVCSSYYGTHMNADNFSHLIGWLLRRLSN